jgi:hypothetical protein
MKPSSLWFECKGQQSRRLFDSATINAMAKDTTTATSTDDGPRAIKLFGNLPRLKLATGRTNNHLVLSSMKLSAAAAATTVGATPYAEYDAVVTASPSWDGLYNDRDNIQAVVRTRTDNEADEEEDLRPWSTAVHGINVGTGISLLSALAILQSGGSHLHALSDTAALCFASVQMAHVSDHFVTGFGKHLSEECDSMFLRKIHKVRFLMHGLAMPIMMFPVIGVAASNGLLTEATGLAMSAFCAAWTLYELWHWTAGYNVSSMELVDRRESKRHQGPYLAGTLNYTSGKVLQYFIPVFTVLGFQLWVGTQTM